MTVPDPAARPASDNNQGASVVGSARERPEEVDLASLQLNLLAAKAAVARSGAQTGSRQQAVERARLLACMEAYSAALTIRRLPIPPRLRDDLRLHRALYRPDGDGTAPRR